MTRRRRVRFPEFEIANMHDNIWRAFTRFRGQSVTAWGQSAEEAEAKAREYISRHYADPLDDAMAIVAEQNIAASKRT